MTVPVRRATVEVLMHNGEWAALCQSDYEIYGQGKERRIIDAQVQ
jgi:hypothetical protein